MAKFEAKSKALELRKEGKSILDISRILSIAKSTISFWCRDIELTQDQQEKLLNQQKEKGSAGRIKGAAMNRDKRLRSIYEAETWARGHIADISIREKLFTGIALYWAEGSKKETGAGFNFINSDPYMIKFMFNWLRDLMNVPTNDIKLNVCINSSHRDRIKEILSFWSNLLDFPQEQFGNTIFINYAKKKNYTNKDSYNGMLRIRVSKSSWLRRRIIGMIKCIAMPA